MTIAMTTDRVPKGARELCTPTDEEAKRLAEIVERVAAKTKLAAAKFPETRAVVLGGSFAKGTWLPREADIDIFVKLSTEVDEARFEEVGLNVGLEATKGYPRGKKYAQHPYTEALLHSIPVLGMTQAEPLRVIRGMVPSPLGWPAGCRFAARCDYAFARCREQDPPLFAAG